MRFRQAVESVPDPVHLESENVGTTLYGVVTSWIVPDQMARALVSFEPPTEATRFRKADGGVVHRSPINQRRPQALAVCHDVCVQCPMCSTDMTKGSIPGRSPGVKFKVRRGLSGDLGGIPITKGFFNHSADACRCDSCGTVVVPPRPTDEACSAVSLWEATAYPPRSADAGHSSVIAAFSASGTDTRAMRLEK